MRQTKPIVTAILLFLPVSILWIDRPVADLCFAHFGHSSLRHYLDESFLPVMLTIILLLAIPALLSRDSRQRRIPILAAIAFFLGLIAVSALKQVFGRSEPDPVYLYEHRYGFHLLHPGVHWTSFPSGTATITVALATVLALSWPQARVPAFVSTMGVCLVLLLADAHWVSDVLAGGLLGYFFGLLVVQKMLRRKPKAT